MNLGLRRSEASTNKTFIATKLLLCNVLQHVYTDIHYIAKSMYSMLSFNGLIHFSALLKSHSSSRFWHKFRYKSVFEVRYWCWLIKISFTVGIPKFIPQVLRLELCACRSVSSKISDTVPKLRKPFLCEPCFSAQGLCHVETGSNFSPKVQARCFRHTL